ncbi:hypothetical protein ABVK25_003687 [Lepraria finkii]|uniref:DUF676 domain-containing protein n=1 Tax=Lepraria finkii TaxID=1340010 RepID=A0ABR4BDX3_9LECA
MSAIMRRLWPSRSVAEPQSTTQTMTKTDRPPPVSTLGLRIANPSQINAAIDIVFIHGLTGGRESTWTAKGAATCWPELLLPNDLPEARIIIYGYDADVVNFWSMASQNTVGDHGQKFVTSLANLRDSTDTSTRPLVFVAHSMGGIVCQDALLKSRGSADQHTQRILQQTQGIVFMGTPHCGSGLAEWAVVGSKFLQYFRRVNQGTLEILQQKSEVMGRIRQDFHTMLRGRDRNKEKEIAIICFYEELPVRAIGEIVPKDSATLDRYTSIGIHANHIDMSKFMSDQDPDYRNVLSELQRFIESIPHRPKEASRFASSGFSETGGNSHNETHYQGQSAKEHGQSTVHGDSSSTRPTRSINTFSGTFNSGGGKMFQGNRFDSKGGPMNF